MLVPFFIGEYRLKMKIRKLGLASVLLLGLAVSQVSANETETTTSSSEENSIQASLNKVENQNTQPSKKDQADNKTVDTTKKQEAKKETPSTNQKTVSKEKADETNQRNQKEEIKPAQKPAHWEGDYYIKADGSMAKNEWIYDNTYKSWFYLKSDGRYARNELQGNYYLKSGGYMAKNEWVFDQTRQAWFYLKSDGRFAQNEWKGSYYLKSNGYMAKNEWVYDQTYKSWFYLKSDGRYAQNEWKGNYYLKSGGYMAKNEFIYDDAYKSSFYFKSDGAYANQEWQKVDGKWYYFKKGGYLVKNQWQGNYYLNAQGVMMQNEWLYDSTYSSYFYLKSDGSYANKEWQKVNGKWYYFKKWGYMAKNEWQGNYYLTGSGAMATGELVIDGVRYIFADSGELKEKKDLNSGWVNKNGKRYFYNRREEQVGTDQAKKVIDISEHNGHISDWKKVINENGVDGVIVRLGYSGAEDRQLAYNIKELNRLGIPYGVYLYTYAEDETDAENDAKQTIALLKKYNMNLSYPIYYDVENWEYNNKTKKAPTDTRTWVKIINKYMSKMRQAGYQNVKVYSYRSLLQTRLNHPDILRHVNWVAAYTDGLDWTNPYYYGAKGWQYTSTESLKGIRGNVDVSVWY